MESADGAPVVLSTPAAANAPGMPSAPTTPKAPWNNRMGTAAPTVPPSSEAAELESELEDVEEVEELLVTVSGLTVGI